MSNIRVPVRPRVRSEMTPEHPLIHLLNRSETFALLKPIRLFRVHQPQSAGARYRLAGPRLGDPVSRERQAVQKEGLVKNSYYQLFLNVVYPKTFLRYHEQPLTRVDESPKVERYATDL